MEADHLCHQLGRAGVAGRTGDIRGELGNLRRHAEHGPWRVRRIQQPANHGDALSDHQATPAGAIRAAIGEGEITEIGQPGVVRVAHLDDLAHTVSFAKCVQARPTSSAAGHSLRRCVTVSPRPGEAEVGWARTRPTRSTRSTPSGTYSVTATRPSVAWT